MKKKLKISKKFNKSQDWEILEDGGDVEGKLNAEMQKDFNFQIQGQDLMNPFVRSVETYENEMQGQPERLLDGVKNYAYLDKLNPNRSYNDVLTERYLFPYRPYENPQEKSSIFRKPGTYDPYTHVADLYGGYKEYRNSVPKEEQKDLQKRTHNIAYGKGYKNGGSIPMMPDGGRTPVRFSYGENINDFVNFDSSGVERNIPINLQQEIRGVIQNEHPSFQYLPTSYIASEYGYDFFYNKPRAKLKPIQIDKKEGLLEPTSSTLKDINPIPFEQGTFFTAERKSQEADRGKKDYFDKKTGKLLGTYEDGGYTWSTQQAPTQQVVGSVENTQTSKPSIQPFQKGYVNPKIMTSKTGEEGLGDDLGGMMVTAALAPGSLPFRASSRLGRVALELANPISGFRGLKSMSSSVDDIGEQLTRATNELPPLNTSSNIYRGSDLDVARYNNIYENINTTNIDPSLQDFHNSIRDRVLNTYNNLPSDEFGFTINSPSRKQFLKKNIIESSIDAIKSPKKTLARLQYDYERGALNPKSLYYNQLMDALPGDKVGGHGLFGDAEKGFKEAMNKSAEVNPGRMFGEANLSSDSFPLLLAQLRRKAKDVDITHTGDFVPLNSFGNKSKSLLTAAKNPQEGQESILKYVNEHIDKLNKEVGSKIPYAKVINRRVHIPYILAEKKGATLTDKLQRNKTVGLLGTGAATLAGIKPAFDYANTYNQEKFEKDYNEYIKNKPLQNWEQYPLQQKKSGGKIKLKPKSSDWEILLD